MNYDIIIIILFTSTIQSIFGTGVLLLGTPLLLLNDYSFHSSLIILLPTSFLINFFQLKNKLKKVELFFYKKLVIYTIPLIIISLYFIRINPININQLIGTFLLIIGLKDIIPTINKKLNVALKYESIYLLFTGIIHGISNLGGALLSAIVFSKNLSKEQTRATIALSYLTFALFQIFTLTAFGEENYFFTSINIFYWFLGLLVFFIIEKFLYLKINEKNYTKIFASFIFLIGLFLLIKK